jgi:hypothetical protein
VCTQQKGASMACEPVTFPDKIGSPLKIISGNFVPSAKASWIMLSADNKISVCVLSLGSTSAICRRFTSKKLARVDLSKPDNSQGQISITYKAKPGVDLQRTNVAKIARRLTKKISLSQQSLANMISLNTTVYRALDDDPEDEDDSNDPDNNQGGVGAGGEPPDGGDTPPEDGSSGDPNPYDYAVNGVSTTCIPGPITVCITRTPVDPFDPIWTGPRLGQTWCQMFSIFCSATGELTSYPAKGSTQQEQEADCYAQWERDEDECKAYSKAMDWRSYNACKQRAMDYYQACLTKVRNDFRPN